MGSEGAVRAGPRVLKLDLAHRRGAKGFHLLRDHELCSPTPGSPLPAVTFARWIRVLRLIAGAGIPTNHRKTLINRDFGRRETGVTSGMHTGAGRRPILGTVATTP